MLGEQSNEQYGGSNLCLSCNFTLIQTYVYSFIQPQSELMLILKHEIIKHYF
jgi:hypothetical protein